MSKEAIVQRILSDADREAEEIVDQAKARAAETVHGAEERAKVVRLANEMETREKVRDILDGKAASARLDSAKALLAEKRRVLDAVYALALERLNALEKQAALRLADTLLRKYAEEGDEVVFAPDYRFRAEVGKLPVVKEKNLIVSPKETKKIEGGFILCGKTADKDISYGALLAADREENQAELAAKIFKTG